MIGNYVLFPQSINSWWRHKPAKPTRKTNKNYPLNFITLSAIQQMTNWWYFLIFPRKQDLTFHANCLYWRQFAWNIKSCFLWILFSVKNKNEAHGPRLAHLSETATADMQMQMLCNIFSILSLQQMKGSSYEQFLVLKKKNVFFFYYYYHYFTIYGHNNGA